MQNNIVETSCCSNIQFVAMNSEMTRLFPKQDSCIFSILMNHQLVKSPTASDFQASHILYKEFIGSTQKWDILMKTTE